MIRREAEAKSMTVGSSALALTFGCARCHNHKFDPITQREYYSMAGAFMSGARHELQLHTPDARLQLDGWNAKLGAVDGLIGDWRHAMRRAATL